MAIHQILVTHGGGGGKFGTNSSDDIAADADDLEADIKKDFIKDINYLKEMSKSIAIITKDDKEAEEVYNMLKDDFDIMLLGGYGHIKRDLVVVPSYTAKGLEFDSVIIYNDIDNKYTKEDKYLYYVACTRAQHNLIIYNGEE